MHSRRPVLASLSLTAALLVPIAPAIITAQQPPASLDQALDASIQQYLADNAIPGAVVGIVEGDTLTFHKAFGLRDIAANQALTTDTPFQIGSVTKSMTMTLMGILRDEGKLDFDDPIEKYLPKDVVPTDIGSRTLRQLATHTAGLPRNFVNRKNAPDSPSVALPYSIREMYEGLATTPIGPPTTGARYSNMGAAIIGHALERASGMTFEALLENRLVDTLKMTSTGITPTPEQAQRLALHYWKGGLEPPAAHEPWVFGEIAAHGGVFSTVGDLAKFVAMQYTAGNAPARAATLAELHAPSVKLEDGNVDLGIGWFLAIRPGRTIVFHDGGVDGNSASLVFIKERHLGVIALANRGGEAAGALTRLMLGTVLRWQAAASVP